MAHGTPAALPMTPSAPPLALPPITRVTLNDLAYARLKEALLSGRIQAGDVLSLRDLAAQLNTSVMPVREAVARLCAENALRVVPNRGVEVPPLDEVIADEIWDLRTQLEGRACALAARRASPADVARIRATCAAVEAAGKQSDVGRLLEANGEFQSAIFASARSPVTLQMIEVLRMKSVPYYAPALAVFVRERPAYWEECWANHDAITEAIATGDAEAAKKAKQRDLRAFHAFIKSVNARK
jgi:DNA-binding GntR family transcriptional regulator